MRRKDESSFLLPPSLPSSFILYHYAALVPPTRCCRFLPGQPGKDHRTRIAGGIGQLLAGRDPGAALDCLAGPPLPRTDQERLARDLPPASRQEGHADDGRTVHCRGTGRQPAAGGRSDQSLSAPGPGRRRRTDAAGRDRRPGQTSFGKTRHFRRQQAGRPGVDCRRGGLVPVLRSRLLARRPGPAAAAERAPAFAGNLVRAAGNRGDRRLVERRESDRRARRTGRRMPVVRRRRHDPGGLCGGALPMGRLSQHSRILPAAANWPSSLPG